MWAWWLQRERGGICPGNSNSYNPFSPWTNITVSFPQKIESLQSAFVCGSVCMKTSQTLQKCQFPCIYWTYSPLEYCHGVTKNNGKDVGLHMISSTVILCICESDLSAPPLSMCFRQCRWAQCNSLSFYVSIERQITVSWWFYETDVSFFEIVILLRDASWGLLAESH